MWLQNVQMESNVLDVRRGDLVFCGTHEKGTPYGVISDCCGHDVKETKKKTDLFLHEINGIMYYLDDNGNVYDPNAIWANSIPTVIAKYEKDYDNMGNPVYNIPSLFTN